MFEKFSDGSRRALTHAKEAARVRNSEEISLAHILLGLAVSESEATARLEQAGATSERIAALLASEVATPRLTVNDPIPFSEAAKSVLVDAVRLATTADGLDAIRSAHLLEAVSRSDAAEGAGIILELGLATD